MRFNKWKLWHWCTVYFLFSCKTHHNTHHVLAVFWTVGALNKNLYQVRVSTHCHGLATLPLMPIAQLAFKGYAKQVSCVTYRPFLVSFSMKWNPKFVKACQSTARTHPHPNTQGFPATEKKIFWLPYALTFKLATEMQSAWCHMPASTRAKNIQFLNSSWLYTNHRNRVTFQ